MAAPQFKAVLIGTLSRLLVESSILLAASRGNPATVLRDAATAYKVNTDAIAAKVKQEFAAKEQGQGEHPCLAELERSSDAPPLTRCCQLGAKLS
jgi:hypothetical protein